MEVDILPPGPVIAPNQSAAGTVGVPFGFTVEYADETGSDATLTATGLPPGLDTSRGGIFGVPTESGNFEVIVVVDSLDAGSSAPGIVEISIAPASTPAPTPGPRPLPPAPVAAPVINPIEAQIELLQARILDVRRRVKNPAARAAPIRNLNGRIEQLRAQPE